MATIKRFEDLEIWQEARRLSKIIHKISIETDLKTDFKFREQIKSSSGSVMDNIAEGFERESNNQFIYFLVIAKGSCGELRTQLYLAMKIKHISEETHTELRENCLTISKQLSNFIKYLKSIKK